VATTPSVIAAGQRARDKVLKVFRENTTNWDEPEKVPERARRDAFRLDFHFVVFT
jgi:hypothetical protein